MLQHAAAHSGAVDRGLCCTLLPSNDTPLCVGPNEQLFLSRAASLLARDTDGMTATAAAETSKRSSMASVGVTLGLECMHLLKLPPHENVAPSTLAGYVALGRCLNTVRARIDKDNDDIII